MQRRSWLPLCAAGILLAVTTAATAQDYPSKPVRIVVPFPPGAINDSVGRMVATHLSNRLGKQFVVENRAAAGGVVGAELVANAPKEGHTLLVVGHRATFYALEHLVTKRNLHEVLETPWQWQEGWVYRIAAGTA